MKKTIYLTEQVEKFIKNNYSKYGGKYCAKELNVPYSCINNFAARNGLKVNSGLRYYKNNIDIEKWKKMENPTICYLLGLIFADGWIDKKRINIQILKSDFDELLPKIKEVYNKATIYNRKRGNWKEITNFTLSSVLLSNMIKELGFKADNFNCVKNIPEYNLKYFFRGYFDGDGHIRQDKTKNSIRTKLQFVAPYDFDWTILEERINLFYKNTTRKSKTGCVSVRRRTGNKNHRFSTLTCTHKEVVQKFLNWIYSNWDLMPLGLTRKHKVYLSL